MTFSNVDRAIWFIGMCSQPLLLVVLLIKRRWQAYPLFTLFVANQMLFTFVLFVASRSNDIEEYRKLYWLSEAMCFVFAMTVCAELFGVFWRRGQRLSSTLRFSLLRSGILCFLLAMLCAFSVGTPTMALIDLIAMRGAMFTSLLFCGCFICFSIYATSIGLRRPKHAMIIGWGMTGIALLELSADFRFFTQGWHRGSSLFSRIEDGLYVVIILFWIAGMWRNESLKRTLSLSSVARQTVRG